MTTAHENPYRPPGETFRPPAPETEYSLAPIWSWLAIAILTTIFGVPADPLSALVCLGWGLIFFLVGVFLGTSASVVLRVLIVLGLCQVGAYVALTYVRMGRGPPIEWAILATVGWCYTVASISCGHWASWKVGPGMRRIVLCFGAGYTLGLLLGPLGVIAGSVAGVSLARKSLASARGRAGSRRACEDVHE